MMDDTCALRPGLLVMSKNVADAVHGVGGLIFDRARLGWQVTVLVPAGADARPLAILGAELAGLAATPGGHRQRRAALVASSALYIDDRRARSEVESALATRATEVLVWGRALPGALDRGSRSVTYRLSGAARAFKAQALVAAGLPIEHMEPVETFRTSCSPEVLARELDVAG
jgi:hypothetical protein